MSKGSKSRISNQKTFNEGWDRIFNKRGNKMKEYTSTITKCIRSSQDGDLIRRRSRCVNQ